MNRWSRKKKIEKFLKKEKFFFFSVVKSVCLIFSKLPKVDIHRMNYYIIELQKKKTFPNKKLGCIGSEVKHFKSTKDHAQSEVLRKWILSFCRPRTIFYLRKKSVKCFRFLWWIVENTKAFSGIIWYNVVLRW